MSSIRMEGWPVVELEFVTQASDNEALAWLENMTGLLNKKQPFVMLVCARPNSHFSPEARKAMGLWFKERRGELAEYCHGVARLVDSVEHGQRVVSDKMKAAMPFPMKATTSLVEANEWMRGRLAAC